MDGGLWRRSGIDAKFCYGRRKVPSGSEPKNQVQCQHEVVGAVGRARGLIGAEGVSMLNMIPTEFHTAQDVCPQLVLGRGRDGFRDVIAVKVDG